MKNDRKISVRLPDGYVLKMSNKARKEKVSFATIFRRAVRAFLGIKGDN